MSGRDRGVLIAVAGAPDRSERDRAIRLNQVTPGYFDTLGIRLLAGRLFTRNDQSNSLKVAVLNDTAARFYFGEANPIGRTVSFPRQRVSDEYEVIGVARDTKYENLRKPAERMVYLPIDQPLDRINGVTVAIRGSMDTRSLVPAIRNDVRLAVPGGFVTNVATIGQQVDESLIQERLISMLASFFGALALGLASIGLYGVMSYAVVRRTREIGVRIALGAPRNSVVWLVLRETLVLMAIGLLLGIPVFLSANRYIKSELFGLAPGDPGAVSGAILVLLGVAAAAGYLPARRASRVEPMLALRYE
jgi:predicted permease